MVNPRRTSSVGREIPLRAAGIRRRRASRSVLRLPTARQLFADENDLTSRVTRYSPVRSFAPSRAYPYRPPRNPPAVLQEEQQPRARPPSPNYSPIQDSSNPSYSPVRTPEDLPSIPEERRPIEQSTETEAGPSNPGQVLDPPEPNFYPEPEDLVLPSSIQPLAGLTDEDFIEIYEYLQRDNFFNNRE
ncbi:proline-rich extensin-like protein EPR1 [Camponotus floridanus]|uniref:proline-rich extensin-like protein EPR1 n=1 Tax=Camponotus floridanus TaxID=104421 RepID=UPI000DC66E98|nr:proline-rich extensin-like protein EPR1 [Camponotus floridanus]XP_025262205.1 proline-rich extensin-like protein EPR1 [Camponotus floridanus]XP_025262206.1 proline-rich extensin-like protein EPR1 [Camponotus floridanus]XP_025263415.1 proline-rich extensin-like protein EPR1 [Camponotus floridanus]XP_025264954.1 proline-rich extensin-like protein EPR1 [Camponotus floridanus]XP_025265083.1 proline-rich extensin-like protein EPR1 [Camponotus floridanus]XP_025266082.1 proline-rich extensin-like